MTGIVGDNVLIEVKGITKKYKKKLVLNAASFAADKGECIGILGANGCGKSTLLAILAGALKPDEGSICYNGREATEDAKVFTENTGYVPQENPIIEELSVKDNLILWYSYSNRNMKDDLQGGVLELLGLTSVLNETAGKLSGGMKKRLSLACALTNQPPILIMDEPSAALDLICKADIHNYILGYLKNSGTVIITTHDEAELTLCSRLYVIRQGKLIQIPSDLSMEALLKEFNG